MENLVFGEILRRGYEPDKSLFFYKTRNNKEIDFVLKKSFKVEQLIQVCYEADSLTAETRELRALIEGSEELQCVELEIITWDEEKEVRKKGKIIKFIPLWQWLLANQS